MNVNCGRGVVTAGSRVELCKPAIVLVSPAPPLAVNVFVLAVGG